MNRDKLTIFKMSIIQVKTEQSILGNAIASIFSNNNVNDTLYFSSDYTVETKDSDESE